MMIADTDLMDPNLRPTLYIGGSQLKPVSCTKHLLMEIDSRLSWSNHTDKICKTVSSGIGIIKRARPFVNSDTSILPLSDNPQRLEKRAARVITPYA